ncbi:serine/threonine-protein kinase [Actinoplanes sp. NPDC049265]|uniref:serine/threonine-protein kinase n=1 Tax=Actinoplanes sp. NPDC049265 TaxID=3363902 RepID=UPI00371ACBA5
MIEPRVDVARRTQPLQRNDPEWLGRYRMLGRLGRGGMGVVFLAEAPGGRLVAVKLVHTGPAGDPQFAARFRSEVNRAREVPAYCTAELLDADVERDPPYLVTEFVDGPSLSEVVDGEGPLPPGRLHAVAAGVATALVGIHGAGVIHRDLKPQNVLLGPGRPKVIDFGIARAFEATSRHTRTDQFVGTVAYMAPERFDNDLAAELTAAADVFAWGCVIAYAGTGRTPFHADSPAATAACILTRPPYLDGLTEPLRSLVASTLAKDPRQRPTAREVLDELAGGGTSRPRRPQQPAEPARTFEPPYTFEPAASRPAAPPHTFESATQPHMFGAHPLPGGFDAAALPRPYETFEAAELERSSLTTRVVLLVLITVALLLGGLALWILVGEVFGGPAEVAVVPAG